MLESHYIKTYKLIRNTALREFGDFPVLFSSLLEQSFNEYH